MTIELTNRNYITVDDSEKLTEADIIKIVNGYVNGNEIARLQKYDDYYQCENSFITGKVKDKAARNKTPNNWIPTAYYSTIVDTLSGYMFADVQYMTDSQDFKEVLKNNNVMIKDMNAGIRSLAYNKATEIVYTTGDGINGFEIKFSQIDPRQVILVFNKDIEPKLFCAIRVMLTDKDYDYKIDVIYNDLWSSHYIKGETISLIESKPLYFKECPVVFYFADDMAILSVFNKIIPYINALDFLITGNANDIEKLSDAILILTKILKDSDLKNLEELKAIMDVAPEERAEYLTKNTDPSFREYASKLIIQEIHKHSHVVDWYSPDSGLSGEISAKAMKTRLFDMDMFSKKVEMVYRIGAEKRIRLINDCLFKKGKQTADDVEIIFNRTLPDDFLDTMTALNPITYISDKTKLELSNIDVEEEIKRIDEQKTANMERFNINDISQDDNNMDDNAE